MSENIKNVRDGLIFKAGQIAAGIGLNKSMGQLYAALYFFEGPVCLNELAKVCRMSKGNVSINIRRLEKWGAVNKVWGTESRKDYYEANRDILDFTLDHGQKVFSSILDNGEAALSNARKELESISLEDSAVCDAGNIRSFQRGLTELSALSKKVRKLVDNFELIRGIIKKS